MMRRVICNVCYVGLCVTVSTTWAFTANPAATVRRPAASSDGRNTRKPTLLQAKRTRMARGTKTELYYANSTELVQEMDLQWKDLMKFKESVSSSSSTEMMPSYDLLTSTQTQESLTPAVVKQEGLSDLWKARLLLIGAAALYGTNFSLVKLLGDVMPVGVSSTLRFGAAALATSPWLLKDIRKEEALMAAWLGFEVGLWNSIGYVAQAVGLDSTPAAESAFVCSLAVVTVPIIDFLAGKKLHARQWVGAILAVVGVAFLELVGESTAGGKVMSSGELLTLVQPFAFGIGFWRMERAMQQFPDQAARMTAGQLLAVFMASAAYGLWSIDMPTLQSYPWGEWFSDSSLLFSILWTGLVTTALTIYMENCAMEKLSAAETTLIFSTEPLWGTAFAAVVVGEQLGPNVALGAAFILTACVYSNLGMEGISNIWKSGVTSAGNYYNRRQQAAFPNPNKVPVPLSVQNQLAWFSSSAATSWAWWRVAASNLPEFDELEETFSSFFEKFMSTIE